MIFPFIYLAYKFIKKTRIVRADEMDFYSDVAEIEAAEEPDPVPKNFLQRIWFAVV